MPILFECETKYGYKEDIYVRNQAFADDLGQDGAGNPDYFYNPDKEVLYSALFDFEG